MSKLLLELLDMPEADLRRYIQRLENLCLNPGVDIRLSAEIQSVSRDKATQLGLDAKDTTPKELYYALKGRLFDDDKKLQEVLKIRSDDAEDTIKKISKSASKLSKNEYSLAISGPGLKKILKAVPPRKTMRLLKLRSIDSFIKRYDPKLVYCVAQLIEDQTWTSQTRAKISRLAVKDIVWQRVEITYMPKAWYEKIADKIGHRLYISCHDSGTICMLPVYSKLIGGLTIFCLASVLHEAQRIAEQSLMYRYSGIMHDYTTAMLQISSGETIEIDSIHGLRPSWHMVHELLGRGHVIADFEPELIVGELEWQSIEMKLAALDATFDFWVGTHFVGVKTGIKPVSLHLLDVSRSVFSNVQFDERPTDHCRASVWNELQIRYMQQSSVSRLLASQLQMRQEIVLL